MRRSVDYCALKASATEPVAQNSVTTTLASVPKNNVTTTQATNNSVPTMMMNQVVNSNMTQME